MEKQRASGEAGRRTTASAAQRERGQRSASAGLVRGLLAGVLVVACSGEDGTQLLREANEAGPLPPQTAPPSIDDGSLGASRGDIAAPGLPAEEMTAAEPAGPVTPAGPVGPVGPPDTIYDRAHLVEVEVQIDPADWEKLSVEGIGMGEILFPASGFRQVPPYTHFTAQVTVDGVTYENVDIRKKGYIGSLSVIRPSLKLDFERGLGGQELVAGNRRMTLNNDLQDPSHLRQCLAYDLFREVGVPASRCNYAHVVVNGVDLGTYTHVEPVAKPMLRRYFENVDGNLYEGQLSDFNPVTAAHLELETNEEQNDRSDVQAVIDALALPDAEVVAALDARIDLDNFFDFWALETLLGHWDGYAGNSNNYFAYHDPVSDKFTFIPWGADQTFVGDNPLDNLDYQVAVYAAGSISNRLYALPDQRARYRRRLAELNDTLWDVDALLAEVDRLSHLAPGSEREGAARVRSYIRNHGTRLRAALADPAPDWVTATPPAQPADACQGTFGAVSGSFDTVWGSLVDTADVVQNGSEPLPGSAVIDGASFQGDFRARAGEDGFLPGNASVRLGASTGDGFFVVVDLSMPIELFVPGYHPLHSFESYGQFSVYQPDFDAFITVGLVGDGGVQIDAASLESGGRVTGGFTGQIIYFACVGTVKSFFPPLPMVPPPGEGDPGEEEPLAPD